MRKLVPRERCMSQGARESRRSGEHRTLSRASRANFSAASLWPGVMSAHACQCRREHAKSSHRRPHTFNGEEIEHEPVQVLL